jgi:hypothetical protein
MTQRERQALPLVDAVLADFAEGGARVTDFLFGRATRVMPTMRDRC